MLVEPSLVKRDGALHLVKNSGLSLKAHQGRHDGEGTKKRSRVVCGPKVIGQYRLSHGLRDITVNMLRPL